MGLESDHLRDIFNIDVTDYWAKTALRNAVLKQPAFVDAEEDQRAEALLREAMTGESVDVLGFLVTYERNGLYMHGPNGEPHRVFFGQDGFMPPKLQELLTIRIPEFRRPDAVGMHSAYSIIVRMWEIMRTERDNLE